MVAISSFAAAMAWGDCAGAGPVAISVTTSHPANNHAVVLTCLGIGFSCVARAAPEYTFASRRSTKVRHPVACRSRRPRGIMVPDQTISRRRVRKPHGRDDSRHPARMGEARLRGRSEIQEDV